MAHEVTSLSEAAHAKGRSQIGMRVHPVTR